MSSKAMTATATPITIDMPGLSDSSSASGAYRLLRVRPLSTVDSRLRHPEPSTHSRQCVAGPGSSGPRQAIQEPTVPGDREPLQVQIQAPQRPELLAAAGSTRAAVEHLWQRDPRSRDLIRHLS